MKKHLPVIVSLMTALIAASILPAYADQHKKEDVSALIAEVQARLDTARNSPSADIVRAELSKIDETCSLSRQLLSGGKNDEAYNEITLCNLYFMMIDARIDLQNALLELDETKRNLSR